MSHPARPNVANVTKVTRPAAPLSLLRRPRPRPGGQQTRDALLVTRAQAEHERSEQALRNLLALLPYAVPRAAAAPHTPSPPLRRRSLLQEVLDETTAAVADGRLPRRPAALADSPRSRP